MGRTDVDTVYFTFTDTKNERPKPAPRGRLAIIKDEQE